MIDRLAELLDEVYQLALYPEEAAAIARAYEEAE